MPTPDTVDIVERVKSETGVDDSAARHAVAATLRALGRSLPPANVRCIRASLPRALRPHLGDGAVEVPSVDKFYRWVAEDERASVDVGTEHARAVCAALAEGLDAEDRASLPPPFDALLRPCAMGALREHGAP